MVNKPLNEVTRMLQELTDAGELSHAPDGTICLTSEGESAAVAVMKKHKVLETFFEEMLGMDRDAAHQQACTLEHHASEETIKRLNHFIDSPPCAGAMHRKHGTRCGCQMLSECNEGQRVRIIAVKGGGRSARLADLGIIPGEEVIIRRCMAKTILIQVKSADIAISADIAKMVMVEICR
jgi:DtxR family Mn-dependent transcriptional regulator